MSYDPFNPDRPLTSGCACGRHADAASHDNALAVATLKARAIDDGAEINAFVEAAMVKALFPQDSVRRRFIRAVGAGTALSVIQSVLPMGSIMAMAQEKAAPEKKNLKIGFIPITCATPLIMASTNNKGSRSRSSRRQAGP
jgi:nitrate/nitrite transport system substrate-binding protein